MKSGPLLFFPNWFSVRSGSLLFALMILLTCRLWAEPDSSHRRTQLLPPAGSVTLPDVPEQVRRRSRTFLHHHFDHSRHENTAEDQRSVLSFHRVQCALNTDLLPNNSSYRWSQYGTGSVSSAHRRQHVKAGWAPECVKVRSRPELASAVTGNHWLIFSEKSLSRFDSRSDSRSRPSPFSSYCWVIRKQTGFMYFDIQFYY